MHYKITIFGACAPYPYWIALSISQGKKDDVIKIQGLVISNRTAILHYKELQNNFLFFFLNPLWLKLRNKFLLYNNGSFTFTAICPEAKIYLRQLTAWQEKRWLLLGEEEHISCYLSNVVTIITKHPPQSCLLDLCQLFQLEYCRVLIPKPVI